MKNLLKTFVKSFTVYTLSPSICGPGSTWFLLLTKQTLYSCHSSSWIHSLTQGKQNGHFWGSGHRPPEWNSCWCSVPPKCHVFKKRHTEYLESFEWKNIFLYHHSRRFPVHFSLALPDAFKVKTTWLHKPVVTRQGGRCAQARGASNKC